MTDHHLAQLNVGRLRVPLDAPGMAEFLALFEPINALADSAPGFVWRLTDGEADDATSIRPYGHDVIVNMSVWESREALWDFAYRSAHLDVLRRRREWFLRMAEPYIVLWWVPAGRIPPVEEARERLERVRRDGPGPEAFTFRQMYDPVGDLVKV
ncbi:DUF3291 domain-containing protein [Actinoallomurus sp. NPDC050550]|uniref:DUF3291 domain-containing protein n=1 Tax=Actinoallomurus sp. NPDC050550 TaxID=3154937 RepID=UPI0033CB83D7